MNEYIDIKNTNLTTENIKHENIKKAFFNKKSKLTKLKNLIAKMKEKQKT